MTLRSKRIGLLSKAGASIDPVAAAKLRNIFTKGKKKREGLLSGKNQNILKGISLESAHNPTPLVLTPGSTGV